MEKEEIYKREGCRFSPNSFAMGWEENETDDEFIMSFANKNKEEHRIDVISEVKVNRHSFVLIFRKMLEVMSEYSSKNKIDLLSEVFNGTEGEEDE